MRPIAPLTATALLLTSVRLHAQPVRPRAIDSLPPMTAHVRASGDTLFFSIAPIHAAPNAPAAPTQVVWFHDSTATMLAGSRRVALSPVMVRVFRTFYADAQACPQPAAGCDMDHRLFGRP